MAHLIDKDALVAEIESYKSAAEWMLKGKTDLEHWSSQKGVCDKLLYFIDTLEVKEVDLDEEISFQLSNFCLSDKDKDSFVKVAKHFFKLGLSVSNNIKVTTPDIDDVLKENGVNPYSKEAKIIKESYFMAIEKLTQKGGKV